MPNGLANLVQQSTDYDMFSFMGANREQNRGHVEALKRAFEEIGNLTKVQPILVNDQYQIIDGQHRFVACKELGLPIFFTKVDGIGVREARSMNILHRNWTTDDYAKSYADAGDRNYQKYMVIKEDYGFSHSVILAYIENTTSGGEHGGRGGIFKTFREGNFVLTDEAAIRARLDKLLDVYEITPIASTRSFALSLLRVMNNEEYSHKRMVKKMRLNGDRLKRYSSLEDNLRMIEEIYNFMQSENNRTRLY